MNNIQIITYIMKNHINNPINCINDVIVMSSRIRSIVINVTSILSVLTTDAISTPKPIINIIIIAVIIINTAVFITEISYVIYIIYISVIRCNIGYLYSIYFFTF